MLARSGISYGPCYYTYKDGSVPSCPNIKVERKNSLWQSPKKNDETTKVVYRYGISITGTTNNFIIDEAIMNVSFSGRSKFDSFEENKVSILNFNRYIIVLTIRVNSCLKILSYIYLFKKNGIVVEARTGQYSSQLIVTAYHLSINEGEKKELGINIETDHVKGQEYCVYDVACTLKRYIKGSITPSKTGFAPITSSQFPFNRIKMISVDEKGQDINRYKRKPLNERPIDFGEQSSFIYGSILQYQCGPGKSFEMNDMEADILFNRPPSGSNSSAYHMYNEFNVSCSWDGEWSLSNFTVPRCVCK